MTIYNNINSLDEYLSNQNSLTEREKEFKILVKKIKNCKDCSGLNITNKTESSPGYGNIYSRVVIVGQSLCRICMKTQIPFTGGSGYLLDRAFKIAGISKSDIFITNVVHCHTPDNRKSLPDEIDNCNKFLSEEINLIKPSVIIPLGLDAVISFLGIDAWPKVVGQKIIKNSLIIYPLYHPSYIMKKGKKVIDSFVSDLANILINEVNIKQ